MTAALSITYHGFEVHLVEKTEQLGGLIREVDTLPPYDVKPAEVLEGIIDKVKKEGKIALRTSTTLKEVRGYIGNFEVTLDKAGKEEKITVGTIVVATGAKPFEPRGYFGYGEYKNVLTQFELEKLITENKVGRPKSVAMIQCVGAREKEGRTYCSRICCLMAIKNARHIKEQFPEASVYIIHRDIRTVGKIEEEYYVASLGEGIKYIRYNPENPPKVAQNGEGTLKIEVTDETLNQTVAISSDMLVLSTPLAAREDSRQLAQLLKVPVDRNGFFFEAHVKLRPVDFATDGIFLCGAAHGPKDIKDSVAQANGAAARALVLLTKGSVKVEAITCEVDQEKCIGCGICVQLCPYGAPQIDGGKTKIIEVLCKGCGACAVSCPTHAITSHQFKDEYYMAQIAALLSE